MLKEKIEKILSGPEYPEHEFIISTCDYKTVYALASGIQEALKPDDRTICVLTEAKEMAAAAVLASLASGLPLVLPYALSAPAIRELQKDIGFKTAVTDKPESLPSGITPLVPEKNHKFKTFTLSMELDSRFLNFFTGGSTGKPRMWTKTPRNIFEEAFFHSRQFGISRDDRILTTVPPYHIYGFLFSVLIPFVSSARVVEGVRTFPQEIRDALAYHSPTILVSVPMHYRILKGGDIPGHSLRLAFSSAGKLNEADGDYFHEQTHADLVEIYGSTETGGIAGRCRAHGETVLTPFDRVDWKIVDDRLYVRSPFIFPDIPKDPEGFFMTGDCVRRVDENKFMLDGRADNIVKVGGRRVDLEEIGNKLKQIQGVQDAFIFALSGEGGRENDLCALVQGDIDRHRLILAASDLIEAYALPRHIKIIDKIPCVSTGKYDRKAIEGMFQTGKS
jgi:acyl-coenzyme A synthetase/AMP-(fatty) acid ligase